MIELNFVVKNKVGLHARPAAEFVKAAAQFKSSIKVRNTTRNTPLVDAKSILRVLTLGVAQNHGIAVQIEGEDEQSAAEALTAFARENFTDAE